MKISLKKEIVFNYLYIVIILILILLNQLINKNIIINNIITLVLIVIFAFCSAYKLSINLIIKNFMFFIIVFHAKINSLLTGTDYSDTSYSGFFKIHIASVYIFTTFIFLILNKRIDNKTLFKHFYKSEIYLLLSIFYFILITIFERGVNGIPQIIDIYLNTLIICLTAKNNVKVKDIYNFTSKLFYINLIISILEQITRTNFLYNFFGEIKYVEYFTAGILRSMGITDHPLTNAVINVVWLYMGLVCNNKLWILYSSIGIILTLSRFAIILLIVTITLSLFLGTKKNKVSLIIYLMVIITLIFSFKDILIERNTITYDSIVIRKLALQKLISGQMNIIGKGIGESADELSRELLDNYLIENPWLILVNDAGIIGTTLFILTLIFVIKEHKGRTKKIAILSVIAMISSFMSFGAKVPIYGFVFATINLYKYQNKTIN